MKIGLYIVVRYYVKGDRRQAPGDRQAKQKEGVNGGRGERETAWLADLHDKHDWMTQNKAKGCFASDFRLPTSDFRLFI
jgi:hypothetical protein